MSGQEQRTQTFDVLRELPTEVSIEQVRQMVTTFPQLPASSSWSRYINLNSILMTTLGTIIIVGSISLFNNNNTIADVTPVTTPEPTTTMVQSSTSENNIATGMTTELPEKTVVIEEKAKPKPEAKREVIAERVEPRVSNGGPKAPEPRSATSPLLASTRNDVGGTGSAPMDDDGQTKKFDLSGFKGVRMLGSMDMEIEQGEFSVSAEGDEKSLEKLKLEVKENTLAISTEHDKGKSKNNKSSCTDVGGVTILVRMPDLQHVELIGSGDIVINRFKDMSTMDMELRGSGDIEFVSFAGLKTMDVSLSGSGDIHGTKDVDVSGKTSIQLAGSGDIHLHGSTDELRIQLAGSGDVEASELKAQSCDVQVVGSGDVTVYCTSSIDQRVTGSGDIQNFGRTGGSNAEDEGRNSY